MKPSTDKQARARAAARAESPATRAPRSGASRKASPAAARTSGPLVRLLCKWFCVVSVLGSMAAAIVWFDPRARIEQFAHRPITAIQIEGHFQMLDSESVQRLVEPYVHSSFLDLDLRLLKAHLEHNPWVDSVAIARVWPDKLVVRLTEQKPIARWGEKGFLNMRGDIIEVEKNTQIQSLPLLRGEDRYAREVMEQYLRMGNLLGQHGMTLRSVDLDATRAWSLMLDDKRVIRLGRDRLWEKLQHFVAAKQTMSAEDFARVQAVDMRYPSGFAVVWRPADDQYMAGRLSQP